MDEGSVGSIFLDLIVRDTVQKQTEKIAAKAQVSAKHSFGAVERSAEAMTNQVAAKSQEMGQRIQNSINGAFSKSVATAQAKVAQLETALASVTAKLNDAKVSDDDTAAQRLAAQQEAMYDRLEAARNKLAIEIQAAAQKEAQTEAATKAKQEAAAQKAADAAEKAAQRAAAAQEREARKNEAAQQKAAQAAAKAHEQSASRIKNAFSKAFSGAKKMVGGFGKALAGIKNKFSTTGKSAGRFGTRLKGIVSGALVFNTISQGLKQVTDYLGTAIGSSEEMQAALANLKGAAATAAAPIIEALTPALTALTNAAATAFSYVSRLASYLTGKSVSDMAKAAKAMQKASDTAKRSTASFDEIEKLGDSGSQSSSANYDFQGQSKLLNAALQAVQKGRWDQLGQIFAEKINKIVSSLDAIDIGQKVSGFVNNLTSSVHGFFTTLDFSAAGEKLGTMLTETFEKTDWAKIGETAAAVLTSLPKTLVSFILKTDWASVAQGLSKALISAYNGVSDWIESVDWRAVGDKIATFLKNIDWAGVVSGAFEMLGAAIGAGVSMVWGVIDEAWANLVNWWYDVAFEDGSFTMSGLLEGIWAGICNIGQWLLDNVVNPFLNGFKEAFGIHSPSTVMAEIGDFLIQGLLGGITETWKKITVFFEDAFAELKNLIKGAINGILGFVNGLISGVVGGINLIVRAMNKLKFDVPDWVPVLGGKTFGFNLAEVSAPQIPLLANGGVIRQPTLAMMGEYSGANSNPEIVAPQSTIAEIVSKAMSGLIESNQEVVELLREILQAVLGIERGDEVYAAAVRHHNEKMSIIKGGSYL